MKTNGFEFQELPSPTSTPSKRIESCRQARWLKGVTKTCQHVVIMATLVVFVGVVRAQSQYAGSYSGTYSGDESGTWQCVVASSGNVTGYYIDPFGDRYDGAGTVSATGGWIMGFANPSATFRGQIDGAGHISGTWSNPSYELSGTFSGNRTTQPPAAPTSTTGSPLPAGAVDIGYSQTLTASGGTTPYVWSIASGSLPAGLSLSSTALISGKPSAVTISKSGPGL